MRAHGGVTDATKDGGPRNTGEECGIDAERTGSSFSGKTKKEGKRWPAKLEHPRVSPRACWQIAGRFVIASKTPFLFLIDIIAYVALHFEVDKDRGFRYFTIAMRVTRLRFELWGFCASRILECLQQRE